MDNVPGRAILLPTTEKSPDLASCGRSARIFQPPANSPLLPSRCGVIERTYFILRNRRIEVKKKYRLMTQDNRHNRKSSFTPSPAHTALRRTARVMAVIIGAVVGLVLMVILKPICRGVGWVISLISAVVIIFWLITNF